MRVLVATGSSGGHIFPALSFIDALRQKHSGVETLLALPERSISFNIPLDDYKTEYLSFTAIRPRLNSQNLIALCKFLKGALESFRLIVKFNPDIVVGFGTLNSVLIVFFAWFFRIKTLIHEQNYLPGRANKFLAKFVDKVAISYKETAGLFNISEERITFTGNPVRYGLKRIDKAKALDFFGFKDDKLTILITGGSQGSQKINTCFLEGIVKIKELPELQIIHIAGRKDFHYIEKEYDRLRLKAKVFPFLNEMQYAYSASGLALTRGGAATVAELIFFELPALIIPYPFANNHQLYNAKPLQDKGCCVILEESGLSADSLVKALSGLIHEPERLLGMRKGYKYFQENNDAKEALAREALALQSS